MQRSSKLIGCLSESQDEIAVALGVPLTELLKCAQSRAVDEPRPHQAR